MPFNPIKYKVTHLGTENRAKFSGWRIVSSKRERLGCHSEDHSILTLCMMLWAKWTKHKHGKEQGRDITVA